MSLKEKLHWYKNRYQKAKYDVRYLREAIISMAEEHRNDPDYEECFAWIIKGIHSEFSHKSETQENNEQIGALVTYLVHQGASVNSAIKTVAEKLILAETKVREAYRKIKDTYEVDPKNATYYELSQFFSEHEDTPLRFIQLQSYKQNLLPNISSKGKSKHSKIQKAIDLAYKLAQYHKIKREEFEEDAAWQQQLEHDVNYQYDDEY